MLPKKQLLPYDPVPDMDLVQPVLDHIRTVLTGLSDKDAAQSPEKKAEQLFKEKYILEWLAAGLQQRRKLGVLLVFHGLAGAGKDILFQEIFSRIYGDAFLSSRFPENITRFNRAEKGRLFRHLRCVDFDDAVHVRHLRSLVDDKTITLREMCIRPFVTVDRRNCVATLTREHDFSGIDTFASRYAVFRVSSTYAPKETDHENVSAMKRRYFAWVLGNRTGETLAYDADIDRVAKNVYLYLMQYEGTLFRSND